MKNKMIESEVNVQSLNRRLRKEKKNTKPNVLVYCGGKSFEHDISILTATTILNAMPNDYNVNYLYQSLQGDFYIVPKHSLPANFKNISNLKKVFIKLNKPTLYDSKNKPLFNIDVLVNCGHGQNCEDGTIAHLCNLCGIATTSFAPTSQAITLDKEYMKCVFQSKNILTTKFVAMREGENIEKVIKDMSFPIIVKPANLGSSIGICIAENFDELQNAVNFAFKFDRKIIFEEYLDDAIEINCACSNFNGKVQSYQCEQPTKKEKFLSFNDKYLSSGKSKGKKAINVPETIFCHSENGQLVEDESQSKQLEKLQKQLSHNLEDKIKNMTEFLFEQFDCDGTIRVDYLVVEDKIYVNEINSIPGSLAYYLVNEDIEAYIDKMLKTARKQFEKSKEKNYYFQTSVLG